MAPSRKSRKSNQSRGTGAGKESPNMSQLIAEKIAAAIPTIALLVSMRLNTNQGDPAMEEVQVNPLTDDLTRSEGFVNPGQKRKAETSTRRETRGNDDKKHKGIDNFGAVTPVVGPDSAKGYVGTYPKCTRCNYHHYGDCPICRNCNRLGHYAKYCGGLEKGCFECGSLEHMRNNCPRMKTGGENLDTKQREVRNFGTTTTEMGKQGTGRYVGPDQKCDICSLNHTGDCHWCGKCLQFGHTAKFCRTNVKTKGVCRECRDPNQYQNTCTEGRQIRGACYECGSPEHFRDTCPKLGREAGGSQGNLNGPNYQGNRGSQCLGLAFVTGTDETRQGPNGATGTFPLNDPYDLVLIDLENGQKQLEVDKRTRKIG